MEFTLISYFLCDYTFIAQHHCSGQKTLSALCLILICIQPTFCYTHPPTPSIFFWISYCTTCLMPTEKSLDNKSWSTVMRLKHQLHVEAVEGPCKDLWHKEMLENERGCCHVAFKFYLLSLKSILDLHVACSCSEILHHQHKVRAYAMCVKPVIWTGRHLPNV